MAEPGLMRRSRKAVGSQDPRRFESSSLRHGSTTLAIQTAPVAQWIEHKPPELEVESSNLSRRARNLTSDFVENIRKGVSKTIYPSGFWHFSKWQVTQKNIFYLFFIFFVDNNNQSTRKPNQYVHI